MHHRAHHTPSHWLSRLGAIIGGLTLLLPVYSVPAAQASSITVNDTCGLHEAIVAANTDTAVDGCVAGSGADTIILPGGTITLTSAVDTLTHGRTGLPLINSPITIVGNHTTITRASNAPTFRILQVVQGGSLTLLDTTITKGDSFFSFWPGGGIFNTGSLTIINSTIRDNLGVGGGGIFNTGSLTITNSTISGNIAQGTALHDALNGPVGGGGGIFHEGLGRLTITNSTISGNVAVESHSGGGIVSFGTLLMTGSLIVGNKLIAGGKGNEAEFGGYAVGDTSTTITTTFNLFGHDAETTQEAVVDSTLNSSTEGDYSHGNIIATSDGTRPTELGNILAPLANNSGSTQTHALVRGSPAIDALTSGPATDQRGVSRPQGGRYDIGAVEMRDPYADAVGPGSNGSITNPQDALNAPDRAGPLLVNLLGGGLVLDMGAAEEQGTGNLTIYYEGSSTGLRPRVEFLDANQHLLSSFTLPLLDISPGTHRVTAPYSSTPTPYRYVKLRGLLGMYRVDAVEAASIVAP